MTAEAKAKYLPPAPRQVQTMAAANDWKIAPTKLCNRGKVKARLYLRLESDAWVARTDCKCSKLDLLGVPRHLPDQPRLLGEIHLY